jgi:hypothetical protein
LVAALARTGEGSRRAPSLAPEAGRPGEPSAPRHKRLKPPAASAAHIPERCLALRFPTGRVPLAAAPRKRPAAPRDVQRDEHHPCRGARDSSFTTSATRSGRSARRRGSTCRESSDGWDTPTSRRRCATSTTCRRATKPPDSPLRSRRAPTPAHRRRGGDVVIRVRLGESASSRTARTRPR